PQSTSVAFPASLPCAAARLFFRLPAADTTAACRRARADASRLPSQTRNANRIAWNQSPAVGRILDRTFGELPVSFFFGKRTWVNQSSQKEPASSAIALR